MGSLRNDTRNSLALKTFKHMLLFSVQLLMESMVALSYVKNLKLFHKQCSRRRIFIMEGLFLIITRKKRGPSFVPCGTPSWIDRQDDSCCPRLTCKFRSCKKLAHQFNKIGGKLSNCNLWSNILWSMRSKALEKSIIQHLIIEPGLSNSASQWWIRWIRACVVGQFFIFPNWRWSMDDLIRLRSQRKTKPSSSLLSTGVREIGLRSLSTDLGLDIFGKGRTSGYIQSVGTRLCAMLALKIEVIGPASSDADDYSTQLGMSSGPVAFCKLMFSNSISTWRCDIIYSSGTEEIGSFLNLSGGRLFEKRIRRSDQQVQNLFWTHLYGRCLKEVLTWIAQK